MRRYFTYRIALLLSTFVLTQSLSACSSRIGTPAINNLNLSYISEAELPQNIDEPDSLEASPSPSPTDVPVKTGEELNVRDISIDLGESSESVIGKLGMPSRIDETEYNFEYYIYNNDYSRLLFIAVSDNEVVGFYTDSLDFNYKGIYYGSDINTVNQALGETFSLEEVITQTSGKAAIRVLMDNIDTQKVTGIYVLSDSVKEDEFTENVNLNIEHMVFDLTNSIRVRNNEDVLSWSSSAALSSRKHSIDMAENNYFNHTNLQLKKPGDRMRAEGISYRTCGENIIAGYGSAILSTHGWFNSKNHRAIILNPKFRYLGVGFTYKEDSKYHTYITQNYFR